MLSLSLVDNVKGLICTVENGGETTLRGHGRWKEKNTMWKQFCRAAPTTRPMQGARLKKVGAETILVHSSVM
jgi:hypothetical protein